VHEVRASLQGKEAVLNITVDPNAPSLRPDESTSFPPEPSSTHPYHELAEHWAPFVAQETWFTPKADYLARFDLDGDWRGNNNWENAFAGSSRAYVYYAAMETDTHWFLIYNMFHPRDYSDKCIAGSCHENDNEGVILTIFKDGSHHGSLQVMETLAHNNVYSHVTSRSIRKGIHNVDGGIEFWEASHPVVFIESGGHGVYGSRSSRSRFTLASGKSVLALESPTSTKASLSARPTPTPTKSATNYYRSTTTGGCVLKKAADVKMDLRCLLLLPSSGQSAPHELPVDCRFLPRSRTKREQGEAILALARQPIPQEEGCRHRTIGACFGLRCLEESQNSRAFLV
jgi:hypothetical protein